MRSRIHRRRYRTSSPRMCRIEPAWLLHDLELLAGGVVRRCCQIGRLPTFVIIREPPSAATIATTMAPMTSTV